MSRAEYKILLSNLSLVCRFFFAASVPSLFKCMEFEVFQNIKPKSIGKNTEFYMKLANNLEPARTLGAFVKDCSFVCNQGYPVTTHSLPKVIERLRRVESLSLVGVSVDTDLFDAVGRLTNLTSLSIKHFKVHLDDVLFPQQPLSQLESFTLSGCSSSLTAVFAVSLSVFIKPTSLRVLQTDDEQVLGALLNQAQDIHLEELAVHYFEARDLQSLFQIFPRMTSITSLTISVSSSRSQAAITGTLPSSSLPNLHFVKCPTFLAAELIPGRPLKSIHLTPDLSNQSFEDFFGVHPEVSFRLLSVLRQSTASVESLHVPTHVYFSTGFSSSFPDLRILSLDYPYPFMGILPKVKVRNLCSICATCYLHLGHVQVVENVASLYKHKPMLPPLTDLHLNFNAPLSSSWILEFPLQAHLVDLLLRKLCPTLRRVVFVEGLECVLDRDGLWRIRVSHQDLTKPLRLILEASGSTSELPFLFPVPENT
jgi:hypothetical protein